MEIGCGTLYPISDLTENGALGIASYKPLVINLNGSWVRSVQGKSNTQIFCYLSRCLWKFMSRLVNTWRTGLCGHSMRYKYKYRISLEFPFKDKTAGFPVEPINNQHSPFITSHIGSKSCTTSHSSTVVWLWHAYWPALLYCIASLPAPLITPHHITLTPDRLKGTQRKPIRCLFAGEHLRTFNGKTIRSILFKYSKDLTFSWRKWQQNKLLRLFLKRQNKKSWDIEAWYYDITHFLLALWNKPSTVKKNNESVRPEHV